MHKKRFLTQLATLTVVLLLATTFSVFAASVPRMATDELRTHLGEEGFQVLDVRAGRDWNGATEKISGAERVDPSNVGQWADNYDRGKTIVLYCA
jgi:rhodanese-related sulfurtransferase